MAVERAPSLHHLPRFRRPVSELFITGSQSAEIALNRATASININISQIEELGQLWNSDVLESVYQSLNENTTDADSGKIVGNRMFYANDYMVQRGSGYVSTLRMYSSRTDNSECLNSQNVSDHAVSGIALTLNAHLALRFPPLRRYSVHIPPRQRV